MIQNLKSIAKQMKLRKKIHYLYNYLENQSILYIFRALFENLNFLGRPNPNFLMNPLKNFTNIYTRKKKFFFFFFWAGKCSSAPAQAEKICLHSKPKVTNRQKIQSTQHTVEVNQPPKKSYIHSLREGERERERLTLEFYLLFNEWER